MKAISEAIRFHRKRSGLSRIQLAEIAGVGKTLIFDIEHGKASIRFDGLQKVLNALNIKLSLNSPLMEEFKKQAREKK